MKKKLIILLAIIYFIYPTSIFCQNSFTDGESLSNSIFKSIATPTAQDLGKYGEIPMNLYTGRANVSIPLYSTTQRNIPLNISLSYDTGGLLINQLPSWTGHGWTLNAGGCITRKLEGYYDEEENPLKKHGREIVNYFHNTRKIDEDDDDAIAVNQNFINDMYYDYRPDIFIFNFMGKTGRFFFGPDKKWHVQCEENIKVVFDVFDDSNYISPFVKTYHRYGSKMSRTIKGFTLIDENGTRYKFGGTTDAIEYNIDFFNQDAEDWRAISWYLTEVQDRLGNTLYSFSYKRGKFITQIFNNLSITSTDSYIRTMTPDEINSNMLRFFTTGIGSSAASYHFKYTESTYDFPYVLMLNAPVYLTKISTLDKTTIDFQLSNTINIPETDFYPSFSKYYCNNEKFTLPSGTPYISTAGRSFISYFSYGGRNDDLYLCYLRCHLGSAKDYMLYWDSNVKKKVEKEKADNVSLPWDTKPWMNPLYVLSFTPLQSIEVSCNDQNNKKQRIKLIDIAYNKTPRLHITSVNMYGKNGNSANSDVYSYKMEYNAYDKIPSDYLTLKSDFWGFYNGDANNNEANPDSTKCGMMSRLIYPTGGYTEFEYEQNTFSRFQNDTKDDIYFCDNDENTGGLRIKSIKNYSKYNELFKKTEYCYTGVTEDQDLSSGQCYSLPNTSLKESNYNKYQYVNTTYLYKKTSIIPLSDSYNSHIGYTWVTERTDGNVQKKYRFTNFSDYFDTYPYRVAGKSWYDNRVYSLYNKYGDKGFARGKIKEEWICEGNNIKSQKEYVYKLDENRYIPSTTLETNRHGFTVGCVYKLYYCNLELQRKIETYDCGINDITEYNMEDWRPNQKDLSFSLRKLKSEKITRLANGKEFDSQEKMYLYLTSELKDHFFPVTDILTYRNGEQTMCHSVIYDTFSNVPNHKLPAKEIVTQYPHFQKHTKVSYDQYDKTGLLLQFTETGKPTTFLSWDNYGRLIKTANGSPNSYITSYNYTSDGQINKITTPNGNATSYNYDSFGRLNAVTDVNDKTLQKIEYNYRKK